MRFMKLTFTDHVPPYDCGDYSRASYAGGLDTLQDCFTDTIYGGKKMDGVLREMKREDGVLVPKAVIGTNAWGDALYGKMVRGSYVTEDVMLEAVKTAVRVGIPFFDTARDYGLGKGQAIVGRLCGDDTVISAKYTPMGKYKQGQVRTSFEKDLLDFQRSCVDIYWLHLPNAIEENLSEMIDLYREGRIRNIGVSNFNLKECRQAKAILDKAEVPLYGVQNHYSLLDRKWEKDGLTSWCKENNISFWAWAVLEEGMLVPPKKDEKKSIMKLMFARKRRKLYPLYKTMQEIGRKHCLKIPQVAMCYVSSKGFVPICGCRNYKIYGFRDKTNIRLSDFVININKIQTDFVKDNCSSGKNLVQ